MILGIDPGLTGALAYWEKGSPPSFFDMPVRARGSGKGQELDPHKLLSILRAYCPPEFAVVERVNAMAGPGRKMGATGAFSFGWSAGSVETALAACEIPIIYVPPATWKRRAGLLNKDKDAARTLAMQLFPSAADQLSRKKDVGRADALLIAYYGAPEIFT